MPQLTLSYQAFETRQALPQALEQLISAAEVATKNSYAPYSKFHVGAALLLESGEIVQGANQENAASPAGLCAERTALYSTGYQFPQAIIQVVAIAATRDKSQTSYLPVTPCGGCRQVIMEFQEKQRSPIQLLMPTTTGSYILLPSASALLPFSFGQDHLTH